MGYVQLSVYGYIYFKGSEFVILLRAVKNKYLANNLGKEGLLWPTFQGMSIIVKKAWQQNHETSGHMASDSTATQMLIIC